jgi:hypothetical protein
MNGFYFNQNILDRINRILKIFYFLHQFPEEIDETLSTFGGNKYTEQYYLT